LLKWNELRDIACQHGALSDDDAVRWCVTALLSAVFT